MAMICKCGQTEESHLFWQLLVFLWKAGAGIQRSKCLVRSMLPLCQQFARGGTPARARTAESASNRWAGPAGGRGQSRGRVPFQMGRLHWVWVPYLTVQGSSSSSSQEPVAKWSGKAKWEAPSPTRAHFRGGCPRPVAASSGLFFLKF